MFHYRLRNHAGITESHGHDLVQHQMGVSMNHSKRSLMMQVFSPRPTEDHKPLPSSGRAGRNLPAAITSGLTLLIAVALALFFARPVFLVFVGALVLLASWEIAGAFARKDFTVTLIPIYLGGIGMIVAGSLGSMEWVMLTLYLSVLVAAAWRILAIQWGASTRRMELASTESASPDLTPVSSAPELPGTLTGIPAFAKQPIWDVMTTVFTLVYVPFLASFVALTSHYTPTPWPIVFFVVVVVCNDLGGWMAGVLFGKHPMAPKLSPKKSWEGFAGSVFLSTAAALAGTFVMGVAWWWCIPMGLIGAVIGTFGDLTESLIKRGVGLKDMSGIMPGHGGIMDRLDSLLMAAPAFYLTYSLMFGW